MSIAYFVLQLERTNRAATSNHQGDMPKLTDPLVRATLVGVLVPFAYWIVFTRLFPGAPFTGGAGVAAGVALGYFEYRRSRTALG